MQEEDKRLVNELQEAQDVIMCALNELDHVLNTLSILCGAIRGKARLSLQITESLIKEEENKK
jgi:hypothetical protein